MADNLEYNQSSFVGGMNLLVDDTRLKTNQYRILFNARNRYDRLDLILSSKEDTTAPSGTKQGLLTFGKYTIIFVSGKAYYKYYTDIYWSQIDGFSMSANAPRYWFEFIPVSQTNYYRQADGIDALANIKLNTISGASAGNLPGLLVQDNINQPQYIYLLDGKPACSTTQTYDQWEFDVDEDGVTVITDKREYVPIGNEMAFVDGILYISSQDYSLIYRSVSGRPLDFVVNVDIDGDKGGDATTTAYSVGVGNITALRGMSDNSLFVAAGNANFSVSKNMTQNAPMMFGEYTFIRKFLFNANCLSSRGILDSVGDTRFIDLTGVRSFNAVMQSTNEGKNSVFTSAIRSVLGPENNPIIQNSAYASAILYNDYELYSLDTIFGTAIAVYDTLNSCWVGFDISQTKGQRVKQFAKVELDTSSLYAITADDKLYQLYVGPEEDVGIIRTISTCSNVLSNNENINMANPKLEIKPICVRVIVSNITKDCTIKFLPYINNRQSSTGSQEKRLVYSQPTITSTDLFRLPDINTDLKNILFSIPNAEQGWKTFCEFEWTNGSIIQFNIEMVSLTPMNPLNSQ